MTLLASLAISTYASLERNSRQGEEKMRAVTVAIVLAVFANAGYGQEITLYSPAGEHVAYIDVKDMTIYLWGGRPAGYIDNGTIWGFNGHHFGWFENGYVRDHNGAAVGTVKNLANPPRLAPLKGPKGLQPLKGEKKLAPARPENRDVWASMSLSAYFGR
jgi:hypothetical protein